MALEQRNLILRVISGVIAGLLVLGAGIFGGSYGLEIVTTITIVVSVREFARMTFVFWQAPKSVAGVFWLLSMIFFLAIYLDFDRSLQWFSFIVLAFWVMTLWLCRNSLENTQLLSILAVGAFGFIYCVLFPGYVFATVKLPEGTQWFLFSLLVVFFGDTFAYFGGRLAGRKKLMPLVSPNKTWEGAAAGLSGSLVAGMTHLILVFPYVPVWAGVLFCLICGITAQSGDLIVSLVKRVTHVKDSGSIMPGHGGILDRLDGLFIACPLVYAFAKYSSHWM